MHKYALCMANDDDGDNSCNYDNANDFPLYAYC